MKKTIIRIILMMSVISAFCLMATASFWSDLAIKKFTANHDMKRMEWETTHEGETIVFFKSYEEVVRCYEDLGFPMDKCFEMIKNRTMEDMIIQIEDKNKLANISRYGQVYIGNPDALIISQADLDSKRLNLELAKKIKNCTSKAYQLWNNETKTCYINEFRKCIHNGTWFWNESSNICAESARDRCRLNKSMQWVRVWNDKTEQYDEYCEYSAWREWYWKRDACYKSNSSVWWDNSTNTCRTAGGLMVTER